MPMAPISTALSSWMVIDWPMPVPSAPSAHDVDRSLSKALAGALPVPVEDDAFTAFGVTSDFFSPRKWRSSP